MHLLDGIEKLYDRLEENPYQFPECHATYLIIRIEAKVVYVLGIFHELENYKHKL